MIEKPNEYHQDYIEGKPSQLKRLVDVKEPSFKDKREKSGQPAENSNYFEEPEDYEEGVKQLTDSQIGPSY